MTPSQGKSSSQGRVLVVDDYADAADIACLLLSMVNCECRAAHTGIAALREAARFDPHIVLLDIGLPDLSGYEVARVLRGRAQGRPLYLAAVTGWGHAEDKRQALTAGFDQYVLKPTTADGLRAIVADAQRLLFTAPS